MEIKDIISKKEQLQQDVQVLLCKFTEETNTKVEHLRIDNFREVGRPTYSNYTVFIKIFI